jgi:hypothetical protein
MAARLSAAAFHPAPPSGATRTLLPSARGDARHTPSNSFRCAPATSAFLNQFSHASCSGGVPCARRLPWLPMSYRGALAASVRRVAGCRRVSCSAAPRAPPRANEDEQSAPPHVPASAAERVWMDDWATMVLQTSPRVRGSPKAASRARIKPQPCPSPLGAAPGGAAPRLRLHLAPPHIGAQHLRRPHRGASCLAAARARRTTSRCASA